MRITPVILCGGSGSRLWPLSRQLYPKQLLALVNERSLLQNTVARLAGLDASRSIIVCHEDHRFLVAEQLRQIGHPVDRILLELIGKNTAPAIAVAAIRAVQADPDTILLVLPSDHVIADVDRFVRACRAATEHAQQGAMVTFGIVPTAPETGYGYIRKGTANGDGSAFAVAAFVEKPDFATASAYIESEDYLWNSGMFAFRADIYLEQLGRFRPDILDCCSRAMAGASVDNDFVRVDPRAFNDCPAQSIDFAVMEHTDNATVLPLDAGWSDVGSWSALLAVVARDSQGNYLHGDIVVRDVTNSYVRSGHRLVAVVGLDGVIVVETADAVLVGHKDHMQQVKDVVQFLHDCRRDEPTSHQKVLRPWGYYERVDGSDRYQVKQIEVNPGASLSLQKHYHRAEHWIVVSGTARVTRGDDVFDLGENESTYIPVGVKHRLANPGKIPLRIVEVQSGSYLGEDDIVRFEDDYDRDRGQQPDP